MKILCVGLLLSGHSHFYSGVELLDREKMASIESLSILKLLHILHVKVDSLGLDSTKCAEIAKKEKGCREKPELVKLVREYVSDAEVGTLLATADPETKKKENAKLNEERAEKLRKLKAKQRNGKGSGVGAGQMPSPEQLRQQAAMIRKDPALVRKSNPRLAKMSDAELMQVPRGNSQIST